MKPQDTKNDNIIKNPSTSSTRTTVSLELYRQALAWNNAAVSLLEHGQVRQAVKVQRTSLSLFQQAFGRRGPSSRKPGTNPPILPFAGANGKWNKNDCLSTQQVKAVDDTDRTALAEVAACQDRSSLCSLFQSLGKTAHGGGGQRKPEKPVVTQPQEKHMQDSNVVRLFPAYIRQGPNTSPIVDSTTSNDQESTTSFVARQLSILLYNHGIAELVLVICHGSCFGKKHYRKPQQRQIVKHLQTALKSL